MHDTANRYVTYVPSHAFLHDVLSPNSYFFLTRIFRVSVLPPSTLESTARHRTFPLVSLSLPTFFLLFINRPFRPARDSSLEGGGQPVSALCRVRRVFFEYLSKCLRYNQAAVNLPMLAKLSYIICSLQNGHKLRLDSITVCSIQRSQTLQSVISSSFGKGSDNCFAPPLEILPSASEPSP